MPLPALQQSTLRKRQNAAAGDDEMVEHADVDQRQGVAFDAQVSEAIVYAANMGARLITLGFGGTGSSTIRGVGANAVNRNFFTGGSNPSTYNLERMDYARGPNSMLFGTGTISGTANAVVKSARIGRNPSCAPSAMACS